MSVLILDHDGLSSHTLAQYLGELDITANVYPAHQLSVNDIAELDPSHIILSPSTEALTETIKLIQHIGKDRPILGIGLGFMAVIHALHGITTVQASLYAGQVLAVEHTGQGILSGLPSPFDGVCYQRQSVTRDNLPKALDVTAWTTLPGNQNDLTLAVKHSVWPLQALLWDPTALLSKHGHVLLKHFITAIHN